MPELVRKDFFQRQEEARTNSLRLIPLFIVALSGVVAAVYVVTSLIILALSIVAKFGLAVFGDDVTYQFHFWDGSRAVCVALVVLILFLVASMRKVRELREGGKAVARLLEARRVHPGTADPEDHRLMNVVEEISVASGVPVPDVYVLDREKSINALVAGHQIDDMIVAVTAGAVRYLTRDELQGVIAHEYSHIFNGDMALKMRLMGWVHGLFAVTEVADWVMDRRNAEFQREVFARQEVQFHPGQVLMDIFMIVTGFMLSFIGWHGAVFGRMIKAAVSRQREHLADAAAVQFTRYPEGLAGAMEKVRKWPDAGQVVCPHAEDASHMFFVDALQGDQYFLFLSTHPPVEQRIERILNMMGPSPKMSEIAKPLTVEEEEVVNAPAAPTGARGAKPAVLPANAVSQVLKDLPKPVVATVIAHVGMPLNEHLAYATRLLASLPAELRTAVHENAGAQQVIFALLLGTDETTRRKQMEIIASASGPEMAAGAESLRALTAGLAAHARVPLIEISLPALRQMTAEAHGKFDRCVRELVEADEELDVFEFALLHILRRHLGARFRPVVPPEIRYHSIKAVSGDVSVLLSLLASAGQLEMRQEAFGKAVKSFNTVQANVRLLPGEQCSLNTLEAALNNIREAGPSLKRSILQACAVAVTADGQIHPAEGELLRAVADALECPMPPLMLEEAVSSS